MGSCCCGFAVVCAEQIAPPPLLARLGMGPPRPWAIFHLDHHYAPSSAHSWEWVRAAATLQWCVLSRLLNFAPTPLLDCHGAPGFRAAATVQRWGDQQSFQNIQPVKMGQWMESPLCDLIVTAPTASRLLRYDPTPPLGLPPGARARARASFFRTYRPSGSSCTVFTLTRQPQCWRGALAA